MKGKIKWVGIKCIQCKQDPFDCLLFYSKSLEAAGTLSAITRRHSSISM